MRIALQNFTGGEIAPTLSARYDLARYRNSVQCMENFVPNLHGAAERRMGTIFLDDLGEPSVLIPFSFSAEEGQNFVLVFSEKKFRVANAAGLLVFSESTPYAYADLLHISYAQVGDIVYLAHSKYPLHKVMRQGSPPYYSWGITKVALNTSLPAPAKPSVAFTGEQNGYTLRYKVVSVDKDGKESLPSPVGETVGRHPSDWVQGNRVTVSWTAVSGAEEYNVYREEAGYFGFVGISTSATFIDNNYQADVADTPREDWDPFAEGNHPGVVAFHQQRMVLAATPKTPQAFYMSRVGDFENFRKSRPLQEDDPVEYLIASGSIDAITWAASFGDLLLGTSGSEYKASGGDSSITTKNINITAQSYWGSADLLPIIIGNSILHVQRHGSRVRDLFYSLEKDGYAGNDLSIMAPHLFDGHHLKQWAYQQVPGSHIWIVRDDGMLLALTYMKEHDIWGWSRHLTAGKVRSVTTISGDDGDVLILVVERVVNGTTKFFLERMYPRWSEAEGVKEAFYVDCGLSYYGTPSDHISGLAHLESCPVAVLADGSPVEGCVVRGGSIDLPYLASIVHVGLPFASSISPMPVEGDTETGTSLGRKRAYGQCTVRLHAAVGGKYGCSREELFDFPYIPARWGEACELFSGDTDFIPGGGQATDSMIWLVQDRPMPFSVTGFALTVDMGQN